MEAGREIDRIIVGLGNPGERHAWNRHNIGFMVVEALAQKASGSWSFHMLSRTCPFRIGNHSVVLVQPMTYMNRSGEAVRVLLSGLKRGPQDLLLVFDDLNLPFGRIRIRERGSAGGHRGLESILSALGTDELVRVRMGIGEEGMPIDKSEFVLADFPPESRPGVDDMIRRAENAITSILNEGVPKTMAIFNAIVQ
ncbi:MAG: aminoacyl-tRNA hydrolase [Acidobacteria bacterium]|nr:aminoacyl-tRNA hydrolase [Acidobacteriota bacterium]